MLTNGGCPKTMLSIRDALEALEGRWKLLILFCLSAGPRRFFANIQGGPRHHGQDAIQRVEIVRK
jgi:hypothetical protein